MAETDATVEWVDCNLGSKLTMKYPSVYLMGERAHGEILSIAFAGKGQHQDAGGKIIHAAPNTTSNIFAKSISKDGGRSSLPRPARGRQGRPRLEVQGRLRRAAARRGLPLGHLPDDPHRRGRRRRRPRGDRLQGRRGAALLPDVPRHPRGGGRQAHRQRLHRADRQGAPDGVRGRDEPPDRAADGGLHWLRSRPRAWTRAARRRAPGSPSSSCRSFRGTAAGSSRRSTSSTSTRYPAAPGGTGSRARSALDEAPPEGAIVMPLAQAAEEHPELVERHLGSVVAGDDPVRRAQRRALDRRHVRLRPARRDAWRRRSSSPPRTSRPAPRCTGGCSWCSRRAPQAAVWDAVQLGRRDGAGQRRRRARGRPERAPALRRPAGPRGDARGSSATQRADGRPRRLAGLGHARLRLGQRQGLPGDPARRRRRPRQRHRRLRHARPPAHRLRHAPGARGARHHERPRLPRHPGRPLERGVARDDQGRPGRPATDAFQESRNLLLSKRAHADAIPGLEILANDVRCTHAAAIAQIDREQLFYLRSHGLPEADGAAAGHRGLPAGARRALRGGPGARGASARRSSAAWPRSWAPRPPAGPGRRTSVLPCHDMGRPTFELVSCREQLGQSSTAVQGVMTRADHRGRGACRPPRRRRLVPGARAPPRPPPRPARARCPA